MKTIAEIRLDNLRLLIDEIGTQERVAELAETSPVYLSQILNGAADSKTGKVRQIGDPLARKLESGCGKELGWLDNVHRPADWSSTQRAMVMEAMEHMTPWQVAQTVKVVAALSEQPPKKSNGG